MSVGHLLFAIVLSGYMGLAVLVEERDLVDHFGDTYEQYRRRVPRYVPRLRRVGSIVVTGEESATVQPAR
jgi:protein-S-isoprenylcysteine O-methyltransferase Ste14